MRFQQYVMVVVLALVTGVSVRANEDAPIPLDNFASYAPAASDLLAPPRKGSDFDEIDGVEVRLVGLSHGAKTEVAVGLIGNQPTAVRGIPIGYGEVKAIHFFHGVLQGSLRSGTYVLKYVVHYKSGKVAEIPVIANRNIGSSNVAQGIPEAKAIQAVVDGVPRQSYVYHVVWNNRRPKDKITSLDVIAVSPSALVGLAALTVELLPAKLSPKRASDMSSLNRLRQELLAQREGATIPFLSGDYPAASKALIGIIDETDAAYSEVVSLQKSLRAAGEPGGSEPKDLRSRINALYAKRNQIQESLTKILRGQ